MANNNSDRYSRQRARNRRTQPGFRAPAPHGRGGNAFGHPKRQYDRYLALAQAALLSGDPIQAQNYYQHAEHYFRVMQGEEEA